MLPPRKDVGACPWSRGLGTAVTSPEWLLGYRDSSGPVWEGPWDSDCSWRVNPALFSPPFLPEPPLLSPSATCEMLAPLPWDIWAIQGSMCWLLAWALPLLQSPLCPRSPCLGNTPWPGMHPKSRLPPAPQVLLWGPSAPQHLGAGQEWPKPQQGAVALIRLDWSR